MRRLVLLDEDYVYPEEQTRKNALDLSSKFLDDKDGIKRSISKLITVRSRFSTDSEGVSGLDIEASVGHEWVIDGIRDLGISTTYRVTQYYQGSDCPPGYGTTTYTYTSSVVTNTEIHQNWGWGPGSGSDVNDWYAQGVFQSSYQLPGWDNNYNHWNHIVAYITAL